MGLLRWKQEGTEGQTNLEQDRPTDNMHHMSCQAMSHSLGIDFGKSSSTSGSFPGGRIDVPLLLKIYTRIVS